MCIIACYYCNTELKIKTNIPERGGLEYIGKCPKCNKDMLIASIECGYEDDENYDTYICWYSDKLPKEKINNRVELVYID